MGTRNKACKSELQRKERNMEDYGLGSSACEKPLGANGCYERLLEQFEEIVDECICCGLDDVKKAKSARAAISSLARKKHEGIRYSREGSTVYMSKGERWLELIRCKRT